MISRQAAIGTAETMYERCDTGDIIDYRDMMVESLKVLPSAQLTPCDVCRYNPPSSMDGKPCCVCPAERRTDGF